MAHSVLKPVRSVYKFLLITKESLENFVLQYCIFPELFVREACLQAEKTIETVKE